MSHDVILRCLLRPSCFAKRKHHPLDSGGKKKGGGKEEGGEKKKKRKRNKQPKGYSVQLNSSVDGPRKSGRSWPVEPATLGVSTVHTNTAIIPLTLPSL